MQKARDGLHIAWEKYSSLAHLSNLQEVWNIHNRLRDYFLLKKTSCEKFNSKAILQSSYIFQKGISSISA